MNKFVNFTNHPSAAWGAFQRQEAGAWGNIIDLPFPAVDAGADETDIIALAETYAAKIWKLNPSAVLCQGEFSLCFAVTALLLEHGIPVLCACSERRTVEATNESGQTEKRILFEFVRFREYTASL